jgi:S-(hydroxymethyl)glutathione dehydrogenase/alcohol dehydrogenase
MKITAAVLTKLKAPLEVVTLSLPKKLSFGQVLVKIHYTTICGAQINEIEGAKGDDHFLPHLLGHEASATVLAMGDGVTTVKKNDLVVMHWRKSNGIQAQPAIYKWGRKNVNAGWVTTFQDYAVVSENRITSIPKTFSKKDAPLLGCAVTTAVGVINNDAQVKIGESVLVFGAGGVGLNIIQASRLVSAYPVIAVDIQKNKLAIAKKFGADFSFNSITEKNLEEEILKVVDGKGVDVAIDTTGIPKVIELCYKITKPQGKVILVGVPKKGNNISIYSLPLHFKKILKGSEGGDSQPHIDIPRIINLIENKRLTLKGLITHEYPLEKINEAICLVKTGRAGRVVVKVR